MADAKSNTPSRYVAPSGSMQVWDLIEAFELDFFTGNLIKYVIRHAQKGGREDLVKARHYLDRIIEQWDEGLRSMQGS